MFFSGLLFLMVMNPASADPVIHILLAFSPDEDLGIPDPDENLFERIIRNPHPESANPRERECTEMLCALLVNTRILRLRLLSWMGAQVGLDAGFFQNLDFRFVTEGAIGVKRDDLRIEGWQEKGEDRELVLLWTIEVKVGASIHESTAIDGVEVSLEEPGLVSQLQNYDHWLYSRPVQQKAGFVLAPKNFDQYLPSGLRCSWRCITWTGIADQVACFLQADEAPATERFLARHFYGFVFEHLWSSVDMTETEFTFDDIALLRAFGHLGRDCEDKVNRLVEPLTAILNSSGVGCGDAAHQRALYKPSQRSVVWRTFLEMQGTKPYIYMGITDSKISVWIESAPGWVNKTNMRAVANSILPSLRERNQAWEVNNEDGWWDLQLSHPLTALINESDQASFVERFCENALNDLRDSGFQNKLETTLDE